MTIQRTAFTEGEGDAYFRRNRRTLTLADETSTAVLVPFFGKYLEPDQRVLEIGCANGVNLQRLKLARQIVPVGVDPSREAIADGQSAFKLDLRVGTADSLDFPDGHFDMVLFGFCLYLIDRKLLMRVCAEADRVLKEGGFLGIWDFDSPKPSMRPYRHREGLWSYKMNYSKLFLANPAYVLVSKTSFSHGGDRFVVQPGDRLAAWLLAKSTATAYGVEDA